MPKQLQISRRLTGILVYTRPGLALGALLCAIAVMWLRDPLVYTIGVALLLIAMGFDMVDGWFATRFHAHPTLTQLADRILDKVVYSIIFPLIAVGVTWRLTVITPDYTRTELLHAILVLILCVIVLIRDNFAHFMRGFAIRQGQEPEASELNRLRTIVAAPVGLFTLRLCLLRTRRAAIADLLLDFVAGQHPPAQPLFHRNHLSDYQSRVDCRLHAQVRQGLPRRTVRRRRTPAAADPDLFSQLADGDECPDGTAGGIFRLSGAGAGSLPHLDRCGPFRQARRRAGAAPRVDRTPGPSGKAAPLHYGRDPGRRVGRDQLLHRACLDFLSDVKRIRKIASLPGIPIGWIAWLYALAGIVRLIYFTLDTSPVPGFFKGLPSPAGALLVVAPLIMFTQAAEIQPEQIRHLWAVFCAGLMVFAALWMNLYPLRYLHFGRFMNRRPFFVSLNMLLALLLVFTPYFGYWALACMIIYLLSPLWTWRVSPEVAASEKRVKKKTQDLTPQRRPL